MHLIIRHKSPKTGEIEEKHLKFPPSVLTDSDTHVYTAVLHPNNTCAMSLAALLLAFSYHPSRILAITIFTLYDDSVGLPANELLGVSLSSLGGHEQADGGHRPHSSCHGSARMRSALLHICAGWCGGIGPNISKSGAS